jgi:hypothetical protein
MEPWDQLKAKTGELLDDGLRSGALTPEEHRWRRGHLDHATEAAALDVLVEDLLGNDSEEVSSAPASQLTVLSQRTFGVADLGRRSELVNILGATKVDLRGLGDQALTLELVTVLGETIVEVPEGVKVRLNGTPVLGECFLDATLGGTVTKLTINAVVMMGSLRVVKIGRKTIST